MLIKVLLHNWRTEGLTARAEGVYVCMCLSCTQAVRNQDTQIQTSHRGQGRGKNLNLEINEIFTFS
jgi:hypothetical protein